MSAGRRPFVVASLALGAFLFSNAAHADAPADVGRAQVLFDDALELMKQQKFGAACPMLAESFALDAAGGTALDLGFCFEHADQLASALRAYQRARDIAEADGHDDRALAAKKEIAELERTTGRIRLVMPLLLWRSEKWQVLMDGAPVTSDDLTAPTPVDQGPHVVVISAPDKRSFERHIVVNDGMTVDVVVDGLADASSPPTLTLAPHHDQARAVPSFVLRDDVPRRNWGIAVGSAGIAGLGVGAVAAIAAASLHAQSNRACPPAGCSADGIDSEKQADRMAWVSNVGFVAGAALVGVGTYLFFSARHSQRVPTMSRLLTTDFVLDFQ